MSQRQTKTFLKQRLEEIGVRPVTRHGQNFLIDLNLVEMIVNSADLDHRVWFANDAACPVARWLSRRRFRSLAT